LDAAVSVLQKLPTVEVAVNENEKYVKQIDTFVGKHRMVDSGAQAKRVVGQMSKAYVHNNKKKLSS
jgi:hypothetical protein